MVKKQCTYIPSKGQDLFRQLRKQFEYGVARDVFLTAIHPKFINDYKRTLSLDAEGVPSYSSLMKNDYIKKFIGDYKILESLNKKFISRDDTSDNFTLCLEDAYSFNTTSEFKDDYAAIVDYTEDGKLKAIVKRRTEDLTDTFNNQYSVQKLNERLVNMFSPLGLTIGMLNRAETEAGRVGITDFTKAKGIARDFSSIIRVANNMEGARAISEEFSHLIIGMFNNDPLVQRSINLLANNEAALKAVLGDEYNDVVDFYEGDFQLVAEEAVGHILQKNLMDTNAVKGVPADKLFKRTLNHIISQFEGYDASEIEDIITEVDASMSSLAKSILSGVKPVTQEDIKRSARDVSFNALSDRIERNIKILKDAAKVEAKRFKIATGEDIKSKASIAVDEAMAFTSEDADTALGLFNYAKNALDTLTTLNYQFQYIDTMLPAQKFSFLRSVRMYTQSYGGFIKSLNDAMIEEETLEDNMFLRDFEYAGNIISIEDVFKELNTISMKLAGNFAKSAKEAFTEFLRPFFGEDFVIPFGPDAGKVITIETLIEQADGDISFTDMWLDSMANSSDVLLQVFNSVVAEAKGLARRSSINDIKDIQHFMIEAERRGITTFDWMFETDNDGNKSGNYISPVNYSKYNQDYNKMLKRLDEKYGVNPKGDDAIRKIEERDDWISLHAESLYSPKVPNKELYKNEEYENLTDDQKWFLNKYLEIKKKFDSLLPENRASNLKAIQMRKSASNRFIESATSPSKIYDNIKESIKYSLYDASDDDQLYGEDMTKKGMTDFVGNEFMTLPVYFTTRLKNPNEITTDVFAALMSYAYMANNYEQMAKIVDPLEVGKIVVTEQRKIKKKRGGNKLVEVFNTLGLTVVNDVVQPSGSNIEKKLQEFMESKVYQKYIKDEGTIGNSKVSTSKLVNHILKGSSLANLGFNYLANTANVLTGVGMQNIEAASSQFFGVSELAKADGAYLAAMKDFGLEIGARIKTSKLALFDEMFDIKQDFKNRVDENQKKNLLQKVFGENVAFLGQDAGDHWLYNRTAIAMALRKQVLLYGRQMSLWDALTTREKYKDDSGIKELNVDEIKELDGSPLNVTKFSRQVAHINQTLFGIYNEDDANAASRVAIGRLLQQYRKWMKPAFNRRFQKGQYDLVTRTYEEGYYRTFFRIANELARGKIQIAEVWDTLKDEEKKNIIRCITELAQFLLVFALAEWIDWPDDKDRPWAIKYAEYAAKRLEHELGGLAPTPVFIQENLKTLKTPIASLSYLDDLARVGISLVTPADWVDEMKSGPYKGMSTLEKNIYRAPFFGIAQYRQIKKFAGDIDTSIQYYLRPY